MFARLCQPLSTARGDDPLGTVHGQAGQHGHRRAFFPLATPALLAAACQSELETVIRSTGFYHAKAKNILGCCRALVDRHGGEVPDSLPDLVKLPGVGRKTANVVLGTAFGRVEGVVVDTHVGRISRRLGLTKQPDAVRAERDLVKVIPREHWIK